MDNLLGRRVGKEGQLEVREEQRDGEFLGEDNRSQATGVARWDETTKDELQKAAWRPLAVATGPSGTTALAPFV